MKKIMICILCAAMMSCSFSTEYGDCISPFEDGDPELKYKISVWNTVWSAIGFEMLFPPVLWLTSCGKCPVARKTQTE